MKIFFRPILFVLLLGVWLVVGLDLSALISHKRRDEFGSRRNVCVSQLTQLDSAKEQWAMDNSASKGTTVTMTDIVPTYLRELPVCPQGGHYELGKIGESPKCVGASPDSSHVIPPGQAYYERHTTNEKR